MIRLETIELMQEGVVFINTSRGQVVDESGLVTALETQQVAACGLDVFEHEPLAKESRLRGMPQVLMTPHIGAYTNEAYQKASVEAVQKLMLYCTDGSVSDELLL
jgi:D-3-phosphoglycerate dehydrogenase